MSCLSLMQRGHPPHTHTQTHQMGVIPPPLSQALTLTGQWGQAGPPARTPPRFISISRLLSAPPAWFCPGMASLSFYPLSEVREVPLTPSETFSLRFILVYCW